MSSEAKIAANRRNAQKSTGPRSNAAKARTRRNACLHGLAITLQFDCAMGAQIDEVAGAFTASNGAANSEVARDAAQAHLEILRVRQARVELINRPARRQERAETDCELTAHEQLCLAFVEISKSLTAFDRYECRALSRRRHALQALARKPVERIGPRIPPPAKENLFAKAAFRLNVNSVIRSAPGQTCSLA